MTLLILILWAAVGFVTALGLIPILQRITIRAVATPFHHTHKSPISRFGGVALAAAFVLVSLLVFVGDPVEEEQLRVRLVIFCSALAVFLLGLWDDIRPVGARKKLIGQVLISIAVCFCGVRIESFQNPFGGGDWELGLWGYAITVFWLVALTNVINLIDGIDGLAGGIALMMLGLLAYVGSRGELTYPILIAAGMVGALLGFLRSNFPPAKIYMGDSGAYLLGFLIAILTLVHSQKGTIVAALIAPMFALALPIVDVSLAILRRGMRGLPIFRPDRKHLHHRLQEIGFSRTRTVLILYGISSVFLLMAFGVFWSQGRWVPILFGCLCLILLLSARSFNFSRDWFAVGRVLENSLELRKETQYALALGRWLEMEAERSPALEDLWADFVFMARKLGFTGVELRLKDGARTWQLPEQPDSVPALRRVHELNLDGVMLLEFGADSKRIPPHVFEHVSELAAEYWLKAATRWKAVNKLPLRFGPQNTGAAVAAAVPASIQPP
jgi:UDP-GlcNAc:undecaprenyl-phosphate GlcNAc-1-phosphate transferase